MSQTSSRRRFIMMTLLAGSGAALAPWMQSHAQGMPLITEDDPTAQAMGYHQDAGAVDTAKFPRRAGDEGAKQFCNNCALYQGAADAEQAGCAIFPGKAVKAQGWCNAWAPKPA